MLTACGEPSASPDGPKPTTGVFDTGTSGMMEGTDTWADPGQSTGPQGTGEGGSGSESTGTAGVVFIDQPDGGMTSN